MKALHYLIAWALVAPALSAHDERRAVIAAVEAVAIPATSPIVLTVASPAPSVISPSHAWCGLLAKAFSFSMPVMETVPSDR